MINEARRFTIIPCSGLMIWTQVEQKETVVVKWQSQIMVYS